MHLLAFILARSGYGLSTPCSGFLSRAESSHFLPSFSLLPSQVKGCRDCISWLFSMETGEKVSIDPSSHISLLMNYFKITIFLISPTKYFFFRQTLVAFFRLD